MKHCSSCGVDVQTPIRRCPLCYQSLTQDNDEAEYRTYPDLSGQVETYDLILRLLLFLSITIVVVSVTVNLVTPLKFPWSFIVAVCIGYLWIALGTIVRRRHKLGFNLMVQLVSLCILLAILGHMWGFYKSVYNYVIPALIGCGVFIYSLLSLVKSNEIKNFVLYFIIVAMLGFVPLLLFALKIISVRWPAVSLAVYSGLSIISLFLFANSTTRNELKKRFNL